MIKERWRSDVRRPRLAKSWRRVQAKAAVLEPQFMMACSHSQGMKASGTWLVLVSHWLRRLLVCVGLSCFLVNERRWITAAFTRDCCLLVVAVHVIPHVNVSHILGTYMQNSMTSCTLICCSVRAVYDHIYERRWMELRRVLWCRRELKKYILRFIQIGSVFMCLVAVNNWLMDLIECFCHK